MLSADSPKFLNVSSWYERELAGGKAARLLVGRGIRREKNEGPEPGKEDFCGHGNVSVDRKSVV